MEKDSGPTHLTRLAADETHALAVLLAAVEVVLLAWIHFMTSPGQHAPTHFLFQKQNTTPPLSPGVHPPTQNKPKALEAFSGPAFGRAKLTPLPAGPGAPTHPLSNRGV